MCENLVICPCSFSSPHPCSNITRKSLGFLKLAGGQDDGSMQKDPSSISMI
jgi:hypothetical protein